MRQIICDGCGEQIAGGWTPRLEIDAHNDLDNDIAGDYCPDCTAIVTEAVREAISDE
jgi:hypothetical protein